MEKLPERLKKNAFPYTGALYAGNTRRYMAFLWVQEEELGQN